MNKISQESLSVAKKDLLAFAFDKFEELILVAKLYKSRGYTGDSILFYNGKYYLFVDEAQSKDLSLAVIYEFANLEKRSMTLRIKEHFKRVITKNAIEKLSVL